MTDTAADRARIAEWGDPGDYGPKVADLLRMAEDGIAAREALARVEALHSGTHACRMGYYTDDPDYHGTLAERRPCPTRRAITGEA